MPEHVSAVLVSPEDRQIDLRQLQRPMLTDLVVEAILVRAAGRVQHLLDQCPRI
jgi:hypothetical protein